MDAEDVQGLPPLAQPAPRQSYAPMAGKPVPSGQWNQAPVTLINSGRIKGGEGWGKKNDPKAKQREWPAGKCCTEHMEVMQARPTALEPND